MGPGGVGFNSDRVEVWDGSTWSFATWGEHTLSEARHYMGTAVIEITLGEVWYDFIFAFSGGGEGRREEEWEGVLETSIGVVLRRCTVIRTDYAKQ